MLHTRLIAWMLASQRRTLMITSLFLVLVAYVDWKTGPHVSMLFFYLIPLFIFTWFLGKPAGYLVTLSFLIVRTILDFQGSHPAGPVLAWNTAVRLASFGTVVWLVSLSKNLTAEVEKLFAAKTEALSRELQFRKESEEAIHRLASQLSAAEDAARRKLGQDVHDAIGQNLTVLQLRLAEMGREFPADSPGQQRAAGAMDLLQTVVQQSRTLTFELYPSMLDDLGLVPTLRRYAEQLESHTTTHVTVAENSATPDLPPAIRAFLFRAVKELVTNSIKHGKAHEVIINVRHHEGNVRIFVDDDGGGFDPAVALKKQSDVGLGLPWITERVRSFGGAVRVESQPGRGTRVLLDVPSPDGVK